MHTYADDVAGMNAVRVDLFERFVYKDGIARRFRRRSCDDKEPSRSNYRRSKGVIAWIYKVNARGEPLSSAVLRFRNRSSSGCIQAQRWI